KSLTNKKQNRPWPVTRPQESSYIHEPICPPETSRRQERSRVEIQEAPIRPQDAFSGLRLVLGAFSLRASFEMPRAAFSRLLYYYSESLCRSNEMRSLHGL